MKKILFSLFLLFVIIPTSSFAIPNKPAAQGAPAADGSIFESAKPHLHKFAQELASQKGSQQSQVKKTISAQKATESKKN
jgi:Skp family chaperone for outer membrane proteins